MGNNERISVPELLFHPSDVGIQQAGVVEAVVQSLHDLPEYLQESALSNVVLHGGSCLFPGFRDRFEADLRALVPSCLEINVALSERPMTAAWEGASSISCDPRFE